MATNKRLNATITIGGGVGRTLTKGLTSTKKRLGEVGDSIRTVEKRQKTLGKSIDTFGRMGKNVDGLRREYGQLTDEMERLRKKQEQLLRVEKARNRVSGSYSKFTGEVGKSIGTLRNASIAAAGVGAAAVGLTSKVATAGDEVAKTSRAIEFNAQSFQEYQFAAERVGVAQGTFNQSLMAFGKRLGELKTRGSGALATQLKEMNPALYETLKTTESTEEAFEIYMQAMRESGDAAERNAMASAAFSRAGLKMGLIAQTSSEEIQRLRRRAEELGYVLSNDDLAAAEKFTDEMTNMQTAMGGVGKLIGAELMPVMSKFFNRFTGFVVENRDKISGWAETIAEKTEAALPSIVSAAKGIGQTMMAVGRLTGKLADLVGGFDNLALIVVGLKFAPLIVSTVKLVGALGSLATAFPMVAAGIKAVGLALTANPIGIAVTAIGAAAFVIYKYWEPIKGFFSGLWDGVKGIFSSAFGVIKKIISWTPLGIIIKSWSGITGFVGKVWDGVTGLTDSAVSSVKAAWAPIGRFFSWVWRGVSGVVSGAIDGIKGILSWSPLGAIKAAWSGVTGFIGGLWDKITGSTDDAVISVKLAWEPIKGFFSNLWGGVSGVVSGALDGIKSVLGWTPVGLIAKNWGGITEFIGGMWDGVTRMTEKTLNWVSSKLEWAGNAIDKIGGFLGFGDDEEQDQSSSQPAKKSPPRSNVMARSEPDEGRDEKAAEDSAARMPGQPGRAMARTEQSEPGRVVASKPAPEPAEPRPAQVNKTEQNTNNNQINDRRGGDTFQISIFQQPGEDAETLAQRVARIIQQQRRQESAGALYDQPAGA